MLVVDEVDAPPADVDDDEAAVDVDMDMERMAPLSVSEAVSPFECRMVDEDADEASRALSRLRCVGESDVEAANDDVGIDDEPNSGYE